MSRPWPGLHHLRLQLLPGTWRSLCVSIIHQHQQGREQRARQTERSCSLRIQGVNFTCELFLELLLTSQFQNSRVCTCFFKAPTTKASHQIQYFKNDCLKVSFPTCLLLSRSQKTQLIRHPVTRRQQMLTLTCRRHLPSPLMSMLIFPTVEFILILLGFGKISCACQSVSLLDIYQFLGINLAPVHVFVLKENEKKKS